MSTVESRFIVPIIGCKTDEPIHQLTSLIQVTYLRSIVRAGVFPNSSLSNMIFFVTRYIAAIPMKRQVVYSFAAPYTRKTLLARQLDKCPSL